MSQNQSTEVDYFRRPRAPAHLPKKAAIVGVYGSSSPQRQRSMLLDFVRYYRTNMISAGRRSRKEVFEAVKNGSIVFANTDKFDCHERCMCGPEESCQWCNPEDEAWE